MARSLTVVLPLPPPQCSPNARGQWRVKAGAKSQAREEARHAVWEACHPITDIKTWMFPWRAASVLVRWFHPTTKHRDRDNIIASLKASIDGLVDSGVLVDDDELAFKPVERLTDKANPRVEIVLTEEAVLEH